MKKKRVLSALTALAMLASVGVSIPAQAAGATVVMLNPADASPFNGGRFDGWGTSLCWWANRVGYSEKLTKAAADAFFSEDGLGLDIARYNLGGGDDPEHNHVNRSDSKVPGVWSKFTLSADGKDVKTIEYNLKKDENQLNMAKAALEANPDLYFEGFSNSAPYFMTVSGCTGGGDPADSDNLKPDMYDDFGRFIADATALFKEEGIEFKSYSPMNEPDTNYWGVNSPKQEGCHFTPGTSQSKAIVETRKALDAKGLQDVIVAGMDETDIDKSVSNLDKLTAEAKKALGRIDTHTYGGSRRAQLKAKAVSMDKTLWMSEVDKGGDGATLANMIITDMNGMQPAAWVMWDIIDVHRDSTFVDPTTGNKTEADNSKSYTDGLWGVGVANHDNETLFLTNKYYTFGQFTKYINPGDTIIASSSNTLAAYNKDTGDIKIVANNAAKDSSDLSYEFDLSAFKEVGSTVKTIRTDMAGNEKWAEIANGASLNGKTLTTTLKAKTVTTYIIETGRKPVVLEGKTIVKNFEPTSNGASYSYEVADDLKNFDAYFAVYGSGGELKGVTKNKPNGSVKGDLKGCGFKLFVWDGMKHKAEITDKAASGGVEYAIIEGNKEIKCGRSAQFEVKTNIAGDVTWSVDDKNIADISQTGLVTAKSAGDIIITAQIGDYSVSKAVAIPKYTLSGTPSWGNDSTAPADSADYTKAADGDLGTYFDGTTNGYVMYDYGEPFKINSVKLAARSGDGMAERTKGAKIQGSNDAITWTDLYTLSNSISASSYTTVTASQMTDNHAYRYFRYTNTADMANIAEFIIDASQSSDVAAGEPKVRGIEEFTDDFEGTSNIFAAPEGDLSADGNKIYASGLERFGNVFMPVKAMAKADLEEAIALKATDRFRLRFNMFAGWEENGKENSFSIKNAAGTELVGFTLSGGGYNLNEMRIGGTDLLEGDDKPIAQCKSTDKKNDVLRGANGWAGSGQNYANNMGLNKTVEIIIDGTGAAAVTLNGGAEDLSYSGAISVPIDIKSLELTGDYNASRGRVTSYDNFDAGVITYSSALATPAPTAAPTDPPTLPANGELINLSFDDGTLASSSAYGKASGSAKFAEVDGKKCVQFDNTASTVITLTDANGNSLLAGMEEFTVSFKAKPTTTGTSWWFFAAPNDNSTGNSPTYLGCLTKNNTMEFERFKNGRPALYSEVCKANEWNDIVINFKNNATTTYINGNMAEQSSTYGIADILGKKPVLYIGKATWGSGEYATGYLDDFVITKGVVVIP